MQEEMDLHDFIESFGFSESDFTPEEMERVKEQYELEKKGISVLDGVFDDKKRELLEKQLKQMQ